ncbi:MAG TPA: tyrosine-type recombinase/integrase [Candidatus Cybelea sp.]|jgi:integrase
MLNVGKEMRKRRGRSEGSLYQRADGLWVASMRLGYSGRHAIRKTKYAKTKQDAQAKLLAMQQRAMNGSEIKASRLTFEDFASRWLQDYVRLQCRETTLALYASLLRNHVVAHIGTTRLQRVSPEILQALYSQLERDGASPRLRQMIHARLHKLFATAKKWGIVSQNPCESVESPRASKRPIRYYDVDQAKMLLEAARDDRYGALYALAVGTGIRQGELFALRWEDVNLRSGTISVRHTLQDIGGRTALKEVKTEKSKRMIVLPAFALEALRAHRKAALAEGESTDWVFPNRAGGPLRKSNFIRREFKPLLQRASLPDIHFHGLRHTAATLLLSQGTSAKIVQEMLGHSRVNMTLDTYSHVTPSLQRSAACAMDELLSG